MGREPAGCDAREPVPRGLSQRDDPGDRADQRRRRQGQGTADQRVRQRTASDRAGRDRSRWARTGHGPRYVARGVLRSPALGRDRARRRGDQRSGGARGPPAGRLAISIFLPRPTGPATQHADAQQVNYVAAGAHTADGGGAFKIRTRSWYLLDGVDVLGAQRALGSVVALGDSITDGVGSGLGKNQRWPNYLAGRLNARSGATLAVIDEGIGGNRLLNSSLCCGVDAVARFERDVGDQPGARDVILLEGINDIGYSQSRGPLTAPHTEVSALQIVRGYERIITLAHTAGLRIFGATLTPFEGARHWTPAGEAKREAVNSWIRTSGAFDGVIDFAGAVADPGTRSAEPGV